MKPDEDFPEVGALLAGFTVSFRFNNESRAAVWDCWSVVGVVAYEIFSYRACKNIVHRPTCFNAALDIASRIVSVCANYRTVLVSNYGGRGGVEFSRYGRSSHGLPLACDWSDLFLLLLHHWFDRHRHAYRPLQGHLQALPNSNVITSKMGQRRVPVSAIFAVTSTSSRPSRTHRRDPKSSATIVKVSGGFVRASWYCKYGIFAVLDS